MSLVFAYSVVAFQWWLRKICERFSDSYVEIRLNVVVDRGRGPTTTNHEDLVMIVTCNTKTGQQGN